MTTIVGMHYKPYNGSKDKEAIVLASDLTQTFLGTKDVGEVILKTKTQGSAAKIFAEGPEGEFALASTGLAVDPFIRAVLECSAKKPEDLKTDEEKRRALSLDLRTGMAEIKEKGTSDFPAFRSLNLDNCIGRDRKNFDPSNRSQLALASRYDGKLGLYVIHPMGLIEPCYSDWETMGSGSEYTKPFIETRLHLVNGLKDVINLAMDSVYYATHKDPSSGGMDVFVIDKEGITSHRETFSEEGRRYNSRVRNKIYKEHGIGPKPKGKGGK